MSEGTITDDKNLAQRAILERISELAPRSGTESLLELAEAYAWVAFPNQNHG